MKVKETEQVMGVIYKKTKQVRQGRAPGREIFLGRMVREGFSEKDSSEQKEVG